MTVSDASPTAEIEVAPGRPLLVSVLLMAVGGALLALPGGYAMLAMLGGKAAWSDVLGAYQLTQSPPLITDGGRVVLGILVLIALLLLAVGHILFLRLRALQPRTVVTAGLCLVAIAFLSPPSLSTDVVTYVAKGNFAHTLEANPYLFTIAETVPDWESHPLYGLDPWAALHNVYGFLWTWVMIGMSQFSGGNLVLGVVAHKLIGVYGYIATLWIVWRLTRDESSRFRVTTLALIGLNPTLIWETVAMAHNESLMLPLWLGAVLAAKRGRGIAAGLLFGAAAGIKWVPLFTTPLIALLLWESLGKENGGRRPVAMGQFLVAALFVLVLPALRFDPHLRAAWEGIGSQSNLIGGGSLTFLLAFVMDLTTGKSVVGVEHEIIFRALSVMRWLAMGLVAGVTLGHFRRGNWARPWTSHTVICLVLSLLATAFLHPWYSLWALPFAVLGRRENPRLAFAVIGLSLVLPLTLCVRIFIPELSAFSLNLMGLVWIAGTAVAVIWGPRVWPEISQPDAAE